jgi:hypothetical protein
MRSPIKLGAGIAVLILMAGAALGGAQSVRPGAVLVEVIPSGRSGAGPGPAMHERSPAATSPDQARIHDLDVQIKALRDQYKSQADPLQAQVKSLREKLDADLKPLEDERHDLVERDKSPAIRALDDDEAAQLAAMADHEKADVEKVHQGYTEQRTALKASFDQKRRDARGGAAR